MAGKNEKNRAEAYLAKQERAKKRAVTEKMQAVLNQKDEARNYKYSPKCRSMAGMFITATSAQRAEVMAALKEMGLN